MNKTFLASDDSSLLGFWPVAFDAVSRYVRKKKQKFHRVTVDGLKTRTLVGFGFFPANNSGGGL